METAYMKTWWFMSRVYNNDDGAACDTKKIYIINLEKRTV